METDYPEEGEAEEDGKPKIKARVLDLPMLIHETVKGIYELMSHKAIPEDPVMAENLLKLTDSLTDEEEDIKYGPFIAADLRDYINDVLQRTQKEDIQIIPNLREFIFSKMMDLSADKFVELIKNILAKNIDMADAVLVGVDGLIAEAVKDVIGEEESIPSVEDYEDEDTLTGEDQGVNNEIEQMKQPKERSYSSLSNGELNNLINKMMDEENWEEVKKISEYLKKSSRET